MDSEKRRKKLESAKEKLAAYQKRKAKKQLVEGQDAAARESAGTGASASDGATSDQEWASSDDDFDLEAGQSEGESTLPQEPQDRQAASPLHQEPHSPQLPQISLADTQKVAELQMALRQRDSLIQQLSAGLEGTAARLRSQQTQAAEFQLLTEQVSVLKGQVSQAEEKLKSQMEQQSASSLALQMAQEEILRLQHCLQEKATQLAEMTLQHSKQTAELRQVQASCLDHQTREVQLQFEFRELQQEHALMLKHAERERSAKAHQDSLSSQDCENLQRELDLLSQEHKNSLNELELLRGQNQDLEMKIVALEKRSSDALEGAGDNTGESLKRELQQLQSEHQVSLEELERLTQENTKFEQALKDLDQNHLSEELQQLQAEHQKSLEELRNLKGENSNLEKALKKLEEGNLNQELHQLQAEHRQSLEELGRLQKENNSLEQALKELEQDNLNFELHKLRAEHQVSLEELERLKQENTNLENALKNLEQDNVNLELQQLRTEHHASLEELGKLKEENTKLEQALKSLEDGNISQDLHLLQADHENSLEELKKLREENVNLEQALKALEQQQQHVGEDRELLETIRAELIELKQERTDYMSHLEDLKSQNDEANSQLTALDDTQRQLRLYKSESDELRSRINTQNSLIIKLKEDLQSCASDRDCLAQTISQEREKHEGELLQLQEEVQVLTQQVRNMVQMVGNLTAEAQTAKTSKEEMAAQLELITSHYRQILQENQVFPSANGTDLIKQVSAIPDAADPATVREVSSAVMESVPSPASADLNTSLNNTAQINLEGDHLAYESKIEALMAGAQILQEENARLQSRVKILQSELDSMHEAEQQRLAEVQGLQTQLTSLHSERNSLILQVDTWKEELGDSENQKAELLVQMETLQQQCQMLEQRLMEGQGGGAASPGSQAAEAQILLTKTADVHSTLSQSISLEAAMESGQVLTYASSPLTSAPNVEAHVVSGTHAFTQTSEVATIDVATGDEPSLHLSDKEDASTQAEDTDENKSLLQEVERQKGLLEDLGEEKQALELQVETLQEKLLKMEETHSDLMTHFTQVEQEAHQLQERVSTSTDESERLRKELQQQTEHLSQVKDDLVRMQAEHTEKLNNAKRMLEEEHSTKLAAMSSDLEVAHTQGRELQSALEETKSLHQTEEETMQQELQALQGENMRLREAALSESQERAEVEDLRLHYEGEMEKLCAEIHHLKMSNEAALSEYKEKIRLMEEEHQTYVHEKSEELNSVKKCLEDSLERVRTQELQIESLEQQMTILQADLDEKSENLVATNAALSAQDRTHQTRLASAMTELTAAERNLGDLQQKLTDVEMELEEKVKECADVQQQLQSAREELRSAQAHAEQQEMRLHSLQEELDLKQSMLTTSASETTQQVTSLEEALASARSEVAALQHRTSQLEADCLAAETCLERSQNEQEMKMKEMQDRITVLQDENLEANGLIQTLQEQAMADKAQFESDLLAVETAHKETCAEYQSQIQDLQERLGHLEEERDRANVTIQTLQDRLQVEKAQFEKDSKELERLLCLTEEDKHQVEINLQSANENLDRVIAEYRSDMEQMKKDIGQLREEKDQLEISGLQEQERIVAEYRQQASLLESKVSALEKEKKEKEDELQVQREENILALEENHQTVKELEERVASLQREKETLKTNFDSCMVEMQQQIHQQETEILSLQSYRAEHAQISERSQEELKMAFEIQVADLEEKLKQAEGDLALLQPQLEALQTEKQELRDQLDSQVPALESNCLALEQEVSKLRQELTATTDAHHKERNQESKNHAAAMADMEETVRQLEEDKSRMESQVVELQRQQAAEKDRMSQSFEQQFAEQDERAHYLEQETSRLRKHLEEMAADHKQEKAELQKLYESQIIDLEDRLAQANANLNVVTKQKRMAEESLAENKAAAEQQVQQLETRCRELQKAYHEAADRFMQTSDLSHQEREQLEATYDASLSAEQEQNAALREKVQQLEGEIVVARRAHREEVEQLQQEVTAASSRADSGPSADLLQELEELKSKVQLMEQVEADRARQLREAPHELNEPHSASSQGPIVDEARALSAQMSGHISSEASLQSALDLAKSEIKDLKETVKGLSEEKQRLTADLLALQKRPEPSPAAPDASSVEDDFDADSLNGSEDGPPGSRQATPSDSGNSNTNATVSGLEAEQAAETDPLGMLCAQIDDLTKLTSVLEARVATLEQECAELTSEKTDLMAENASLVAKLQLASKELPSSADIEAAPVPATLVYEPTQQPTEVEGDWENEGRLEDSSQDLCDRDAHMEMSTNDADMKNTNLSLMELNESLTEEISTLRDEVSSLTAEMSNLQSENSVLLQHNTQLAAWKDQESEGDRTHLHILMAEVVALREQAVSLNSLTKTVKGPRATMKYSPAWMTEGDQTLQLADLEVEREHHAVDTSSTLVESDGQDHGELQTLGVESTLATHDLNEEASESVTETSEEGQVRSTQDQSRKTLLQLVDANRRFRGLALSLAGARATTSASMSDTGDEDGQKKLPSPSESEVTVATGIADELALLVSFYELKVSELTKELGILQQDYAYLHRCRQSDVSSLQAQLLGDLTLSEGIFQPEGHSNLSEEMQSAPQTGSDEWPAPLLEQPAHARGSFEGVDSREGHFQSVERTAHDRVEVATQTSPIEDVGVDKFPAEDQDLSLEKSRVLASSKAIAAQARVPATTAQDSLDKEEVAGAPERVTEHPTVSSGSSPLGSLHANVRVTPEPCMTASESEVVVDEIHKTPPVVASASSLHTAGRSVDAATSSSTLQSASLVNCVDKSSQTEASNDLTPVEEKGPDGLSHEEEMEAMREQLLWEKVEALRNLEAQLAVEKKNAIEEECRRMEQQLKQQLKAFQQKQHQSFIKAYQQTKKKLQQAYKDKLKEKISALKSEMSQVTELPGPQDAAAVERLHKENQELAEARDELLHQVEISSSRTALLQQQLENVMQLQEHPYPGASADRDWASVSSDTFSDRDLVEELELLSQQSQEVGPPLEYQLSFSPETRRSSGFLKVAEDEPASQATTGHGSGFLSSENEDDLSVNPRQRGSRDVSPQPSESLRGETSGGLGSRSPRHASTGGCGQEECSRLKQDYINLLDAFQRLQSGGTLIAQDSVFVPSEDEPVETLPEMQASASSLHGSSSQGEFVPSNMGSQDQDLDTTDRAVDSASETGHEEQDPLETTNQDQQTHTPSMSEQAGRTGERSVFFESVCFSKRKIFKSDMEAVPFGKRDEIEEAVLESKADDRPEGSFIAAEPELMGHFDEEDSDEQDGQVLMGRLVVDRSVVAGSAEGTFTDPTLPSEDGAELLQQLANLESDRRLSEDSLAHQLELFSAENQQLQKKCETLQSQLDTATEARLSLEDQLATHNSLLSTALHQARAEKEAAEESELEKFHLEDLEAQMREISLTLAGRQMQISRLQRDIDGKDEPQVSTSSSYNISDVVLSEFNEGMAANKARSKEGQPSMVQEHSSMADGIQYRSTMEGADVPGKAADLKSSSVPGSLPFAAQADRSDKSEGVLDAKGSDSDALDSLDERDGMGLGEEVTEIRADEDENSSLIMSDDSLTVVPKVMSIDRSERYTMLSDPQKIHLPDSLASFSHQNFGSDKFKVDTSSVVGELADSTAKHTTVIPAGLEEVFSHRADNSVQENKPLSTCVSGNDTASFCSSGSQTDASAPLLLRLSHDQSLDAHQSELLEELTQLRQELQETKMMYSKENLLLQKALERENNLQSLVRHGVDRDGQEQLTISALEESSDNITELRQKLAAVHKKCRLLEQEAEHLRTSLGQQESLCLDLHAKLQGSSSNEDFSQQLQQLQAQRDDLLKQMQAHALEHEQLNIALQKKTVEEETLRQEKQLLAEKLKRLEQVNAEVTSQRVRIAFLEGEQMRLEGELLLRDQAQQELTKQKRLLEEELLEIEGKLREQEYGLQQEKTRLLRELQEKNLALWVLSSERQEKARSGKQKSLKKLQHMDLAVPMDDQESSMPVASSAIALPDQTTENKLEMTEVCAYSSDSDQSSEFSVRSQFSVRTDVPLTRGGLREQLRMVERRHHQAVEMLRRKLQLEFGVQQARLREAQAADLSARWRLHRSQVPAIKKS